MNKIFILLLLSWPALSLATVQDCEQDTRVQYFFDQLEGGWSGKAVTTPVGPRPYDISFARKDSSWIYGMANPGAAHHHWGFYCEDGQLWLRFLSTFRGNRSPTLLKAQLISDNAIRFKAIEPAFLEVKILPGDKRSSFEVLHHGTLHVLIELERAKSNSSE